MAIEIIYGLECQIPEMPIKISNTNNKFERILDWVDEFKNIEINKDGLPIYTPKQWEFINRELDRCDFGYWFINNGKPTYIVGFYYYYLNYWTLENSAIPEYREADRRFFQFFQECYDDPTIIGIVRAKHRRLGASSQSACIGTKITTFDYDQNFGIVSFKDDVAEKLFKDMIYKAFYKLPVFLRPRTDSSSTNKTNFHFIETPQRGKNKSETISGLNSKINYESTTLNAYDSTRQSFLMIDESGKWSKVDITRYFEVAKECVRQGATKVGMIMMPTTMNPENLGGGNFRILWDGSNHFEQGRETSTGMVQYFQPAYDGLDGFIDEFGQSVIYEPDEETLKFLLNKQNKKKNAREKIPESFLRKGAKKYLEDEFNKLKTEEQKSDFRRKFPFIIDHCWDFGSSYSPFNLDNIKNREIELKNFPVPLRRGKLEFIKTVYVNSMGDDETNYEVKFVDDENGGWLIYALPEQSNMFEVDKEKKIVKATNTLNISIGVDTFRFDSTKELGSMGAICVGNKFDMTKSTGNEGGEILALYVGRPKLVEFFNEEILKCCLFYGGNATVEHDAGQEYRTYFSNRMKNLMDMNCMPLLGRKPNEAINPAQQLNAKNVSTTSSGDPYVFSKQISLAQIYFEKYCHKIHYLVILEDAKKFNPDNRTKSDITIAFMMCLLNMTGETKAKSIESKANQSQRFIREYKVKSICRY